MPQLRHAKNVPCGTVSTVSYRDSTMLYLNKTLAIGDVQGCFEKLKSISSS